MTKRKLIFIVIVAVILSALYWFYSHSFIEVTVENSASNKTLTYSFKNQGGDEVAESKSSTTKIKKMVSKADYEVLVKQNGSSYFSIVKTKGFLSTTKLSAKLVEERSRKFIGDSPDQCAKYIDSILLSYSCGDYYGTIKVHVPAANTRPSYADRIRGPGASGRIEGFINSESKNFVLLYGSIDEDAPSQHQIYRVDSNYALVDRVVLSDLDQKKSYLAKNQEAGFIVYDSQLEQVLYYPSTNSKPVSVYVDKPQEKGLIPTALTVLDSDYLALYSSQADSKDKRSEAIVKRGATTQHFVFNKSYSSARFCGDKKICLMGDKKLDVYNTSSKEPKLFFTISDISSIESTKNGFLVVNKEGVLNLNVDNRSGYYEFTFGGYKFNDINVDMGGYILSITNSKNRKVALWIDRAALNHDNIDKKILDLQKIPEVTFVTIYDKYIYVAGELGPLAYDSSTKRREYSPETKKNVADKINKEIDRLGIDRKTYTITSNAF